jgi:catechol 2,3-dioxygenase-like lactoylglutathione lyase family enzyme
MKSICLLSACLALCFSSSPQKKDERPKITGIDNVAINVSDLKAARDFYATKLGLNENGGGCDDQRIRGCFTVNWVTGQRVILKTSTPCPKTDCLDEVVFRTADARKLRSFLASRGVTVGPLQKYDDISLSFDTQDPEGHRVSFRQQVGFPINDPGPGIEVSYGRIIHAGFVVKDRAAEDHFYKDILGFRPYWHGGMKDDETSWVAMQVPDGTDWVEYMLNISPTADKHTLGVMNHIALGVEDIHETEKRLIANGWTPGEKPKLGRDGKWQLNVYDPDDTRVEFMEFTPKEKPCCSNFTGPHPGPKQ